MSFNLVIPFTGQLPFAVVPVFVNAGAALLPAIIGTVTSAVLLLFKPKELFELFRQKPQIPVLIIGGCFATYLLWEFFSGHLVPASRSMPDDFSAGTQAGGHTDWTKVALQIIEDEQRAKVAGGSPLPTSSVTPLETQSQGEAASGIYFRGGSNRGGFVGTTSPLGLVPLWEFKEEGTMYLSSPLVAGDRVFGASCYLDPPGSDGAVFCLDAETGQKIWETETKDGKDAFKGFFSSPAISADGQSVVIGQGLHDDFNSEMVCFDAKSGHVKWLVSTPLHVESSPAIEGDIAVAGAGAIEVGEDHKPKGDPEKEGNPGFVFGVRISDGKELWKYPVNDPESSPVIDNGIVYIGSGLNGAAVAALRIAPEDDLKAKNLDRLVWKTPTPFPATGAVTLAGDVVLIGCGNGDFVYTAPTPQGMVIALEKATGKIRWSTPMPDAVLGAIAVKDGRAICPVRNGEIMALDVADGKILWRQEDPAKRISGTSPILCGPAFSGTKIYATSQDGYLAVLDAATGVVLEKHFINAKDKPGELGLTFSSPFVANGRVYVGSETGGLQAFSGTK